MSHEPLPQTLAAGRDPTGRAQARRATGIRGRLVVAATALALVAASAACGGDAVDPPRPAESRGSTHNGHSQSASPPTAPLRAGERFVTLTMPQPYTPVASNGGTDEYRCFLVDPGLSATSHLTGSQFQPQNLDIVHHAIVFRISPTGAKEARELDERTPGEGWQCFGDSGIDDDAWIAHWAPGANEVLLDKGLGYEMPPGSQLVMQVHYSLLATNDTSGSTDQSSIRLRIAHGGTAMTALTTLQLPAPVELPCTAQETGLLCDRDAAIDDVTRRFGGDVGTNAAKLARRCGNGKPTPGATQHCDYPINDAVTVHAAAGHMHLLGQSIKIEVYPGTSGASVQLDVPRYNFDDQAIRPLPAPVKVKQGDVLRVTCTHDANLRRRLPQLQRLPPRYVVWGDGTVDEMCLGLLIGTQT
jgi:hypothetical protein